MALKPVSEERKFEIVTGMFLRLLYKVTKGDKKAAGLIMASLIEQSTNGLSEVVNIMETLGELAIKGTPEKDPADIRKAMSELRVTAEAKEQERQESLN